MAGLRAAALEHVREIVGAAGVVDDPGQQAAYLIDERRLYRGEAALIVRPASTDEVSRILTVCHEAGLAVVPQGGNTGYCGAATPDDPNRQVLMSLARMNRIRDVDLVGFTMTVEAGVVLARAQAAAAEHQLFFPLSMGSEGSCQIGGNLSTNAGGLAVLKYGTARELVLGLEVVLPDGQVLHGLKGLRKDNTGYDLKQLFMGAEGTLGVITAAVLKLYPQPTERQTAWLAVTDSAAACRLLGEARRISGDCVTSFEYVSRASLDLVLGHVEGVVDPLDRVYDHYVLLEMSAAVAQGSLRELMEHALEAGMASGDVLDGAIAESGPQRSGLWKLRESIPEAEKKHGGAIKHDVSVLISRIPEYLASAPARVAAITDCHLSVYGHIGDGNLHYNLLPPAGSDPEHFRKRWAVPVSQAVHGLAAEMDGSFSAEHGVGKLKKGELQRLKDPVDLAAMRAIKQALDPRGIMNPGKLF